MKKISDIYNKVWRLPKSRLAERIRNYCDGLDPKRRIRVVATMSGIFLLAAFFAFGHACYRLGQGHSRDTVKIEHMRSIDLPAPEESKSISIEPYEYPAMDE